MTDVFTVKERSALMAKVRGKGNRSTEQRMLEVMRARRITGWRRHLRMRGTPDFAFPARKVAVFVDGCFWHGCPRHCRYPKTRRKYWRDKILRNAERDRDTNRVLRRKGWKVIRVWECELKDRARLSRKLRRLRECLG